MGRRPVKGASVDQDRRRPIPGRLDLDHVLSGFLVDGRRWSSAEPSSVVQSIQALDGQNVSELRFAAALTIQVRWTFQPAGGAETSHRVEHGVLSPRPDRRHPAARHHWRSGGTLP